MITAEPKYDSKDQLARVQELLIEGEELYFVFDCKGKGTGFLGVTDRRIILRDDSWTGRDKQILTIPFSRLIAVGVESDKGLVFSSSKLVLNLPGADRVVELRGEDKARLAYDVIVRRLLAS